MSLLDVIPHGLNGRCSLLTTFCGAQRLRRTAGGSAGTHSSLVTSARNGWVRGIGKFDKSYGCRSWPFVTAKRILAGPQGHGKPLWIGGGNEVAPHRFDFIGMTFWACRIRQSPYMHCGHAINPNEIGATARPLAKPSLQIPSWSHRLCRRLSCTCCVSMTCL